MRAFKLLLALLITSLAVSAFGWQSEKGPEQPVSFSHKLHAGDQKLKCATCHRNAGSGDTMGLPQAGICMQCHEDVKKESPEIQKLAGFQRDKTDIKWRRVFSIPSYVFFSHRSHLNAGTSCDSCHGDVKGVERMYQIKVVNMASCVNCHQEKSVSTDCTYCHEKMN